MTSKSWWREANAARAAVRERCDHYGLPRDCRRPITETTREMLAGGSSGMAYVVGAACARSIALMQMGGEGGAA